MILNISGRTDIVGCYTPWLMNRLREGYVYSRNPHYKQNVYKISLKRDDVDCIIFCSKNYEPILKYIAEISDNYNIICHYTITPYGRDIEPNVPGVDESIRTLRKLSKIIGRSRVIWRYDPILLTEKYTVRHHMEMFEMMCGELSSYVNFCIFSFVDMYRRLDVNMPEIIPMNNEDTNLLLGGISGIAREHGLKLQCCGTDVDYGSYGVVNSSCTTADILKDINGVEFKNLRSASIRKGCHCVQSRDIGAYDTCPNGCKYCYANRNRKVAMINHKFHDKNSKLLSGKINRNDNIVEVKNEKSIMENRECNLDQWF